MGQLEIQLNKYRDSISFATNVANPPISQGYKSYSEPTLAIDASAHGSSDAALPTDPCMWCLSVHQLEEFYEHIKEDLYGYSMHHADGGAEDKSHHICLNIPCGYNHQGVCVVQRDVIAPVEAVSAPLAAD